MSLLQRGLLAGLATAALALPCAAHAQDPAPATPADELVPGSDLGAPATLVEGPSPTPASASPESPSDVAPAGEETMELSEAELAQLGLSASPGETAIDTSLKFWGFADFTLSSLVGNKDSAWRGLLGRYPTFAVGNFNLYLAKNLTERLRTMAEVRFSYAPNGIANAQTGVRTSTTFMDYASNNQGARWGGIMLQRVYVEATLNKFLNVRFGQFLTPYGIWNIDHGSPTIVPVQRPSMLNQNLFPESQTGIELFGRARLGAAHVLGYHLTLSNGFGPVSEYRDLDRNKAVGGRAFWQLEELGQFQLGGSVFYGRDTASIDAPGIGPGGGLVFTEQISRQSDVLSLAADLRWTFQNFLLQSEVVTQQRKYTAAGRAGATNPLLQNRWVAPQDDFTWGVYGLVGYRFEWLGIMPYASVSKFQIRDPRAYAEVASRAYQGGLNIRPVDVFVVKLEYVYADWAKENFISNDPIQNIYAQVAWAF